MYEVFNWGYSNDEPPKRFSLSIVGSEINIDDPPAATVTANTGHVRTYTAHHQAQHHQHSNNNNHSITNTSGHRQNVAIDSARAATTAAATTTTSTAGKSSQSATAAATFNYSSKTSAAVRHKNPKRRFTPSLLCSNAQNVFVKICFLFFLVSYLLIMNSPVSLRF